jgi:hypothetical protein
MDSSHLLAITLPPLAVLISTAVLGALVAVNGLWCESGAVRDSSNAGFTISDDTALNASEPIVARLATPGMPIS